MAQLGYLEVDRLSHSFGPTEILCQIDFRLDAGEVVALVGPSGGGKTTLLHICAGLLEVTQGKVINTFASFACAFQDARLLPWQTALNNVAFGLKARGIPKAQRQQQAQAIAERFGLDTADLAKYPKDLSGGMRQRVAFARALVIQPALLFLDEPFSALDIGLKQELQSILIDWVEQQNSGVLFITHDLMEAVRLSHRILLLDSKPGRIVAQFAIDLPLQQRSDTFVYQKTATLLAEPLVMQTFELQLGARHG